MNRLMQTLQYVCNAIKIFISVSALFQNRHIFFLSKTVSIKKNRFSWKGHGIMTKQWNLLKHVSTSKDSSLSCFQLWSCYANNIKNYIAYRINLYHQVACPWIDQQFLDQQPSIICLFSPSLSLNHVPCILLHGHLRHGPCDLQATSIPQESSRLSVIKLVSSEKNIQTNMHLISNSWLYVPNEAHREHCNSHHTAWNRLYSNINPQNVYQ